MKEPLAFRLRPETFDDIIGQQHLVAENGILRKFIKNDFLCSIIFYGSPGVGKTTLATILAKEWKRPFKIFNAVTGNKKDLDTIFFQAKISPPLVLICDEVHRLNKDKQDLLLPHLEDGSILLLGATTANPYHAINPAIRSRCHLLPLYELSDDDIFASLKRALIDPKGFANNYHISDQILQKIANLSSGDVRYALNLLEVVIASACDNEIKEEDIAISLLLKKSSYGTEDSHYNLLSAFQKSIRGSDVNAALYYLACILESGDLEGAVRRLQVIAYEDIGLANPALAARTYAACQSAKEIGYPEAILPLGMHIIDLCLSAKSRTATDAIKQAHTIAKNSAYNIPSYLHLTPTISKEDCYRYDRYDCFHKIRYLPKELENLDLFPHFANNPYEQQLKNTYEKLKKVHRSSKLRELYK